MEGYSPSVPEGEVLSAHTPEWERMEALGLQNIGNCAFGIVAGGLGERLGYNGIKLALPTEVCTECCFLEYYCKTISAFEKIAGRSLPLMIMTSDDTDRATRELLAEKSNFGLQKVTVLKQGKVPSISDNQVSFAPSSKCAVDV